jgi:hypothetical protein
MFNNASEFQKDCINKCEGLVSRLAEITFKGFEERGKTEIYYFAVFQYNGGSYEIYIYDDGAEFIAQDGDYRSYESEDFESLQLLSETFIKELESYLRSH